MILFAGMIVSRPSGHAVQRPSRSISAVTGRQSASWQHDTAGLSGIVQLP